MFLNLSIPYQVVQVVGNYANSLLKYAFCYSALVHTDHSELNITRKDDGYTYSKMEIL